ncbi:MAG: hypothetical protein K0S08_871 [Gammaproteobacteria bacterium]|nr:hypothetical protein [Gammaproteobacteria bacterium]
MWKKLQEYKASSQENLLPEQKKQKKILQKMYTKLASYKYKHDKEEFYALCRTEFINDVVALTGNAQILPKEVYASEARECFDEGSKLYRTKHIA